jgi:hypothetical protein
MTTGASAGAGGQGGASHRFLLAHQFSHDTTAARLRFHPGDQGRRGWRAAVLLS